VARMLQHARTIGSIGCALDWQATSWQVGVRTNLHKQVCVLCWLFEFPSRVWASLTELILAKFVQEPKTTFTVNPIAKPLKKLLEFCKVIDQTLDYPWEGELFKEKEIWAWQLIAT
jgi:hypothetical protein